MKIQPRTIKHEKFKEMVKAWLDTHREEYCSFVEEVGKRDRSGFQHIFQYAQMAAPGYANAVMAYMSEKEPKDFGNIEKVLKDADIASTLANDLQSQNPDSIVPAMLAWLYFGNSWETMVAYNEEMIQDKKTSFSNRLKARFVIFMAIKMSIFNEHRTKEDWENFRKIQKSIGSAVPVTDSSIEELENEETPAPVEDDGTQDTTDEKKEPQKRGRKKVRVSIDSLFIHNAERMKEKLSCYLKSQCGGNELAMLYICLKNDAYMSHCEITTFHNALVEGFPEIKFVAVRSVQKAHKDLTTDMMGGKRLMDFGEYKKMFDNIRRHFAA